MQVPLLTVHVSYEGLQYRRSHVQTRHVTSQYATRVWVEKIPQKVKNCLRKAGGSVLSDLEGVPKWQERPENLQNPEGNTEKPQTNKALPNKVSCSVVKEIFQWLGFKRPSTY